MKNLNFKNQKGITLIALVITIIVLLILAGVSITMLTGDNGLLTQAGKAKTKTDDAQIRENIIMAYNSVAMKKYTEGSTDILTDMKAELEKTYGEGNVTVTESDGTYTVTINGTEYTFDGETQTGGIGGDDTGTLPTADGTTPYLPSEDFTQVAGTDLSTGLVITDKVDEGGNSIGNEYVWIEVPNDGSGPDYTSVTSSTDYDNIESALHDYTSTYRNGTSYTDTYYSDDTTGLTETEYNNLKQTMLKSVYENGGFWIGRYEAGIETNRTSHISIDGIVPMFQANLYPLTYVYCSEAQTLAQSLATKLNLENYTSSLMFGVQWDLVLKYLETKGATETELNEDSTSWGNYYNAKFTIDRGKYAKYGALSTWYEYTSSLANCVTVNNNVSTKESASSNSYAILLTTGAADATSKQNIYDIAGNVWEWTLEYTSYSDDPCARRGGSCYVAGSNGPASYRSYHITTGSNFSVGFRVALY